MALDNRLITKLKYKYPKPRCPVCDEICCETDALEYIKTKRGTEIFIHTKCVKGGNTK
jgi:hypothetical protein